MRISNLGHRGVDLNDLSWLDGVLSDPVDDLRDSAIDRNLGVTSD